MNRSIIIAISILCLVAFAIDLKAQERWNVELRPAVNIPVDKVNGAALGAGPGLEANVAYMYTAQWGVRAGVGYGQFNRSGAAGVYYEEIGASLGLEFLRPLFGPVHGSVGAGTVYHRLSMVEGNGHRVANSDLGFGWQVEGGLPLIFSQGWSIKPSVRYRSLSREFSIGDTPSRIELDHVSVAMAFAIQF